jgi:phage protein U
VGYGDDEFTIEGLYYDAEFGGHGDYLALKALARQAQPIELIGWAAGGVAAQVFGLVVILEVSAKHAHITSAGVGAKVEFSVKCAPFGDDGPAGGLY